VRVISGAGETESSLLLDWIRSRARKREESSELRGVHCIGCRTLVSGANDEELRGRGAVNLVGAGWFCGAACERQYRFRFRLQTPGPDAPSSPRSTSPHPPPRAAPDEGTPPGVEEMLAILRIRRRGLNNGQ
jgi:hypothetical protein